MFDYLIFIGRFQPFHLAHLAVVQQALQQSRQVIILLGSAQPERSLKNIFTAAEREQMIRATFGLSEQTRLHFAGLADVFNDKKWMHQVEQAVAAIVPDPNARIGLIGHFKDQSSYYLSLFPQWPLVELDNYFQLSATPIRDDYLLGKLPDLSQVPASTLDYLLNFQQTSAYTALQQQARLSLKV